MEYAEPGFMAAGRHGPISPQSPVDPTTVDPATMDPATMVTGGGGRVPSVVEWPQLPG